MTHSRVLQLAVVAGCTAATGLAGVAIGAPAQAATTPKLCTTKGKIIDVAATLDSLTTGTFYLRNCTGRTIKNVGLILNVKYPTGSSCPPSGGGMFGSGNADPHEFDHVPFATGLTPSCKGRYTHTFIAVSGKTGTVFDRATVTFTVK